MTRSASLLEVAVKPECSASTESQRPPPSFDCTLELGLRGTTGLRKTRGEMVFHLEKKIHLVAYFVTQTLRS